MNESISAAVWRGRAKITPGSPCGLLTASRCRRSLPAGWPSSGAQPLRSCLRQC